MSGSEQSTSVELETLRRVQGRPVLARPNGDVYVCKGFEIQRTGDDGASWTRVGALPRSGLRQLAERSRLACRLLRHEVRALARLSDGTYVAANRAGLYRGREGDRGSGGVGGRRSTQLAGSSNVMPSPAARVLLLSE